VSTPEDSQGDRLRALPGGAARGAIPPSGTALPMVRQGDAFKLINNLPDRSVDLIITSPPYWGLRTYGLPHDENLLKRWRRTTLDETAIPTWDWYSDQGGVLGLEPYPEWYVEHLRQFFATARRVLKPRGSLWLNLGDTYFARWSSMRADGRQGLSNGPRTRRRTPSGGWRHDKQLLMVPARAAIALQSDGWILRNDLIWQKTNAPPRPERDRLRQAHEHLFHFVLRRANGRPSYHYELAEAEERGLDVVAHAAARSRDDHTATFPAALIRHRILSSCPVGGVVFDPFCGTGMALQVAVESGRLAHGFELSPTYARAARANVRKAHIACGQIAPTRVAKESSSAAKAAIQSVPNDSPLPCIESRRSRPL
jgi:site-specific DNA-methyltransferase (cytosine-N4-specific)